MKVLLTALGVAVVLAVQVWGRQVPAWRAAREADNSGPGPETCGQERKELAKWYMDHGSPGLVLSPKPPLFEVVHPNPYLNDSNPPEVPDALDGYCGMQWSGITDPVTGLQKYRLANFLTEEDVEEAGYEVTHQGHCGACSSLQDLGVYMYRNLTEPTRLCGALGIFNNLTAMNCLGSLGFSLQCGSIWWWNIINTREECTWLCILAWLNDVPNTDEDGNLNKCLQCDETKSGPNFQYFAGRTRRNSGIPSSIDRPDEEIYDMEHCYYYGLVSASANRVPVFASASASLALLHLALAALAWR